MSDTTNMVDALLSVTLAVQAKSTQQLLIATSLKPSCPSIPMQSVYVVMDVQTRWTRETVLIEVEIDDGRTTETVESMADRLLLEIAAIKGPRKRR